MIGVVKIAAVSAVLAAALVSAMEPAPVTTSRGDRLVIEFEPTPILDKPGAPAAPAKPVRVIEMGRAASANS